MIINSVFYLVNKIFSKKILFVSPHFYSFGNCAQTIFISMVKARRENKKILILCSYDNKFLFGRNIVNNALFNLESRYIYQQPFMIKHLFKLLVTIMILPARLLDRATTYLFDYQLTERQVVPMVGYDNLWATEEELHKPYVWNIVNKYDWKADISVDYEVNLPNIDIRMAKKVMSNLGVNDSSWYVCIHVRESGFRNDAGRREYRNSNIMNYIPAIKEITKAGGVVFRMGDSSMTPLPEMENVIDYALSEAKSGMMDLFLIKNCEFYIATDSGIYDAAYLLNKKMLCTNMVSWLEAYPLRKEDRGIYKHIYAKNLGRFLTFEEILSDNWEYQNLYGDISHKYVLVENTPDDIKSATLEYLDVLRCNDFSHNELQERTNSRREKMGKIILENNTITQFNQYEELSVKYRLAISLGYTSGAISACYLDKYYTSQFCE